MLCDQIGKALIDKLKRTPQLLLTNEEVALELQEHVDAPLAFCSEDLDTLNLNPPENQATLGQYQVLLSEHSDANQSALESIANSRLGNWDWLEPIERIREAIQEAHRAAA